MKQLGAAMHANDEYTAPDYGFRRRRLMNTLARDLDSVSLRRGFKSEQILCLWKLYTEDILVQKVED